MIIQSVNELIEAAKMKMPIFELFNVNRRNCVVQWQPKGSLSYSVEAGFVCCGDEHKQDANKYIEMLSTVEVGIAIAPEYSMPYDVIGQVICERTMWPRRRALWCFGMEGISICKFKEFCARFGKKANLVVDEQAINNHKGFLSAIAHIFVTEDEPKGQLVLIFQLKMQASKDIYARYEGANLCVGETLYCFDYDGGGACQAVILALICADFFNDEIVESICKRFNAYKILLLNPQLNPKPNSAFFRDKRSSLFSSKLELKIITANWAAKINVCNEMEILHGQSSFHQSCNGSRDVRYDEKTILDNFKNGLVLSKEKSSVSWNLSFRPGSYKYFISSLIRQRVNESELEPICNNNDCEHNCMLDEDWISKICNVADDLCVHNNCRFLKYEKFCCSFIYEMFQNTFFSHHGEHKLLSYNYYLDENREKRIYYTSEVLERNPCGSNRAVITSIMENLSQKKLRFPKHAKEFMDNFSWRYNDFENNIAVANNGRIKAKIIYKEGKAAAREFMEKKYRDQEKNNDDASHYIVCYSKEYDVGEMEFFEDNENTNTDICNQFVFKSKQSIN